MSLSAPIHSPNFPMSSAMAKTSPFIADVTADFDEPSGKWSVVERAYRVKTYLCIPDDGQGPSYAVVLILFEPDMPVIEADPSGMIIVLGSISKTTQ